MLLLSANLFTMNTILLPTRCFLIVLLLVLALRMNAEDLDYKPWEITIEDFEPTVCPIDSSAKAYYIFDDGHSYLHYVKGFKLFHTRHFRIKILDDSAINEASFDLKLYKVDNERSESLSSLKAKTYNLLGGDVVCTSLPIRSREKVYSSKDYDVIRFTLPDVKKGSIIEVEYKVKSDFYFNINGWDFQHEIPVLKSTYSIEIPDFFVCKEYRKGPVFYSTDRYLGSGAMQTLNSSLDYTTENYKYEARNVPAFKVDHYLTTSKNYISNLAFDLISKELQDDKAGSYIRTWGQLNQRLMKSDFFGLMLKRDQVLRKYAQSMGAKAMSDKEKMNSAFDFIKEHTVWDGSMSVYASQSFRRTLKLGKANSADINLSLVALLRQLGLNASPVVLSTRDNGFVYPNRPSLGNLNYVIASCEIDSVLYLMDATCDLSSVGLLPERCLNGNGLQVMKGHCSWIPLGTVAKLSTTSYNLNLDENGVFEGTVSKVYNDYSSYLKRFHISSLGGVDPYIEDLESNFKGLDIEGIDLSNLDELDMPLVQESRLKITNNTNIDNRLITFKPLLNESMSKNPLTLDERPYPVEYLCPSKTVYEFSYTLPDNYDVVTLPENMSSCTVDTSYVFNYFISKEERIITVSCELERTKNVFYDDEYVDLKQFYEGVFRKQNETVELKKR